MNKTPQEITAKELKKSYLGTEYVLLDVRTPSEVKQEKVEHPNYKHIDIYSRRFKDKVKTLDADKKHLILCRSGSRSRIAQKILKDQGIESINIKDGMKGWKNLPNT